MLEVKPTGQLAVRQPEVAEKAKKPSPVPLLKHLLGGCTIDRHLPAELSLAETYRFTAS